MKRNQQDFRTEKYIRYGIRKYSFGAASVAIAAGLMFLGTGVVAAAETQSEQNTDTALVAPAHTSNQLESEKEEVSPVSDDTHAPVDKETVTGTAPIKADKKQTVTPATEESTKPQEVEKKEDVKPSTAQENETKENAKAEVSHSIENKDVKETSLKSEENPSLNLSSLKEKLAGLESQIERIQGNAKQAAHISNAEKLASEAKRFLESLDTTQKEVDAKAKEISSLTSILKSMKAEETVKENKNQDSRNGKKMEEGVGFRTDTATGTGTGTGISADVVDATSTPAVEKTSFTDKEAAKAISKQIAWLDFGDVANWTNLGSGSRLKVGSTYTKEVMPGYHVTIKVKSLKPFQATEIYRKRMEAMGATDEEKATFDPNATNGLLHIDGLAEVSATDQGDYSEIKKAGIIDAGTRKISIGSTKDGANIGVQFEISGTYKGRTVRPSVVMLDSESNDFGENIIFTTNGRGWEKVLEINKNVSNPKGYVPINNFESPKNLAAIGRYQPGVLGPRTSETAVNIVKVGSGKIAAKYLTNPDRVTGGLGTGVFGPVATAAEFSIPVVMTRDASEVGLYILTGGQQRSMMGIAPIDEGDAPESYGDAFHMISTKNGLTGAEVNQPYLGSERPDMDTNNTKDWLGDDKSPEANNDPHADEGIKQILPDNLKNVDRQIIKLDRTNGNYTYSLDIQAHTGGAPQAHIYGWIDFNNNGKFDEDERSELATITNDSTVTLHFNRSFTEVDPKLVELGTRVRIATNAKEIEKPTGVAFSGEVEDFKTQITHPPRGEQVRTEDRPRITQSGHITFTALGKVAYKVTEDAEIRTDIPPVYIDNKTGHPITLPADGIYTVAGQGTYKITLAANNKDVDVQFTPEDGFVGEAHGITIRRQDTNDATTGWINRNTNTSMDGLYIPKVVVTGKSENASSSNLQGLSQSGTPVFRGEWNNNPATPTATNPAKLVDPRTNEVTGATTVDALDSNNNKIGTYTIEPTSGKVIFTPKKDFTGTPIPAIVSLDLVDGHDKDGQPATTLIRAKYSPTVIPITPQAEASTTSGVQGKPQTSPISLNTPDIETNTVNFNKGSQEGPNRESVELDATTLTLLDGDGHEVTSVTIPQQGKYELNKTNKTITFTPNKDFVGPATPVKVQIKDVNGTKVETTYTPTVTDVTMESKDKTSEAPQGKTQTGTPEFKVSDPNVQISGYKLVDPVSKTPVDSTEIEVPNEGTYKIDKTTGQVTFIPKPEFKGPATGITVQATDENGETKDATYKPTVTPIEVTPGDKTTKDIQGVPQSETPTFTIPDGVTNASITSRKLVDPTNNQPTDSVTLEGKGTFTINGNGKVTFTPVPSYTGDVPAIKVEATITVTNEKNESTTITSTANYKPVIVPVEIEKTPAESTNLQGLEQTGRPTFTPQTVDINGEQKTVSIKPNSYKLVKDGAEVPTTPAYKQGTTEEIGTYTINASTGEVTFTPTDKTYTGPVEPAVVQATGSNGSKVNTTYTPSITPVSPTAEKSATSGVQGKPQISSIVLDTKETGDDKGTTVNFNKGTEEGPNGERVNLDPTTLTLLDSSNAPVDSVTTPQGKYELNKANKTITFTPNKDFVGPATPVKVQIKDVNGTKVETTYTPTVTDVTMESKDKTSEAPQGQTQTGKPEFTISSPNVQITGYKLVDPVSKTPVDGTEIEVPEQGTYKIDKTTGQVTFIPKPGYTGTTDGITVQATDENGETKDAKYTPTVNPFIIIAVSQESKNIQGVPQEGTPTFTIPEDATNASITSRKLVDPSDNTPKDSVTIEGKGTFVIDETGKVTFTPVPSYTGDVPAIEVKATVTVTNEKNETATITQTATYKPEIVPVELGKTPATSTNLQGLEQKGTPTFTGSTVEVNGEQKEVTIKENSYTLVKDGAEVTTNPAYKKGTTDVIGTYTIDPATGEVTLTPTDKTYTGEVEPAVVQATGSNNVKVQTTYTPTITPVTPTAEKSETSDVQGKVQTSPIKLDTEETGDDKGKTVNFDKGTQTGPKGERVELDPETLTLLNEAGEEVTSVTTPQGKYELDKANKTISFTPNKDFVGTATPVKVQIKDVNGTKVETTYTPTVTDVTMESVDKTSEAPQGQTQTGKPEFTISSPDVQITGYKLVDPVSKTPVDGTEIEVPEQGTYKIDKTTGQVTFIPKPGFTGPATGITVQATDGNGETKDAKYTPTVTPLTVTPENKTSKNIQGVPQEGTPTFTIPEGVTNASITSRKLVDPTDNIPKDSVTVEGKGTFVIDETGKVTFTPVPSYTGEVPAIEVEATVTVTNEKNEPATITSKATYKPEIVPVEIEKTPAESTNLQGLEQTGRPTFTPQTVDVNGEQKTVSIKPNSYKLVKDGVEVPTTPAYKQGTTEEIGTYTINASTGEVTFTPIDKTYTGAVEPAVVQATGSNGAKVNTTYTPIITPVSPIAEKSATSGVQGKPQTSSIVLDTKETGDDKGTTVNFNKGIEQGPKGERTELNPDTLTLLNEAGEEVTSVTTPQGKYELDKTNKTITFTPNKDFAGEATPVKVQIKDANGTKVETTYTPTVEEVTPTGKDSATTGPQGVAQTSPIVFNQKDEEDGKTVNFDTGHELVAFKQDTLTLINGNGEKVTTITVPEVGTYELKDGAITFTPVKTFKGTTEGVTIQIEDENGKVVTKKYVPTVEKVTPTGENSETEGPKAQPQTSTIVFDKKDVDNSTVNFNKGHELVALDPTTITLVGRDGSPATEVTISGEGTYTLANNIITFTPESDFAGKATGVTVQVKDANGTVVAKTYTPTVRPITEFKDKEGNTIPGSVTEDGRTEKKDFPEYRFIETKVDEKGNTKHIYEKVSTFFKDKEGNELPNTPSEKGTVEKKEVPEYRFVETKKLPNGDTEHVYEKVSTFFKDKEGNELPNTPSEKGTVEKKEVPEYRFVETKKLPNGDTEHVYEKVSTFFKDKEGNELPNTPSEKGTVEKKEVPEYRFVETKKLPNGDTEHVYEKVSTFFKDKEGNELPNTPSEKGTVEKKEVPEYRFVETKKLPNGDTEHVYEKVSTYFKDKEGNELPNTPSEKGTVEKKEVPEYRFVETKKDEKGNTIHVYQKVSTTYVDEEGKEINPSDKGTKGNKEIPDYIFKETKKDEKGNTIHVYQKVSTTYVDEEGKEINPSDKGTKGNKEIPDYIFKETKKDEKGNTIHVYQKVSTTYVDEKGKEINPSDRGTKTNKDISGYTFKETKKDEKGNTIHIYTKKSSSTPIKEQGQSTIWKDVDGNVIKSRENGKKEHSAIEGYVFDHSELDINGNTVHIYRKVSEKETSYVDENGKSLQISKKGQHPQESISGYEFVRTETDANGNVRHVYRKIPTSTTGLASTSEQSVQSSTEVKNELPNTGTETNASLATLGLLGLLSGFGLVARKKKED